MVGECQQVSLKEELIGKKTREKMKGKQFLALLIGAVCLLAFACAAHVMTPRAAQVDAAMQLKSKTDVRSSMDSPTYYWPSARGNVGSYTQSPYPAPINFNEPSWTWSYNCCLGCTYCTEMVGVVLDEHKCIYLTATDGIRKFSPTGALLWRAQRKDNEVTSKVSALLDGAVHGISEMGRAYAVSMHTGEELWSRKLADVSTGNYGQVAAQHGVVIHPALPNFMGSNSKLFGLNCTDGRLLWEYAPDVAVWNFGATFPGDGTFIFQTLDGTAYRSVVNTGAVMWKSVGVPFSWTDGQSNLGSNGVVYSVAGQNFLFGFPPRSGYLRAHRLSDGHVIWRRHVSKPPNSIPAVGTLAGQTKLSVVIPVGVNDEKGAPIDVHAFDAATGEHQWVFKGPVQLDDSTPSDGNPEALAQRKFNNVSLITLPNSWGTPVIDGSGAVIVGGITGHLFRLQDLNQDGKVAGHGEVTNRTTDADFVGSSSPAIAPGFFAVGNSHYLYVWNGY